jgi:hypothetical protein
MKREELREAILRLEEARLRIAPDVMGGKPGTLEEDERLERRIRELAQRLKSSEQEGEGGGG